MSEFRWIVDEAMDGATNMARDEALLRLVGEGQSPPTLRFYRWDPPTISLGYFQEFSEFTALPAPAGELDVVRRQTGGGAILHDRELTYALVLPVDHPLVGGKPTGLYTHVHDAFSRALATLGVPVAAGPPGSPSCSHGGPFFCFERHSSIDLLAAGRKLMGSAQRRTSKAILQHGSLILDNRFPQQRCASVSEFTQLEINSHLPALAQSIAGTTIGSRQRFSEAEEALAVALRAKYAGAEWTRKR